MCDTFVALPNFTATGNLILAKNSDREPNEAQAIVRFPAAEHSEKEVQCTYISIPQIKNTNEVILSKPFEMWGAEMGANNHGVVIGNEAVFTKIGFAKKNSGLTGMDMLRLALERTSSADAALELITKLIAEYGQDACGGYQDKGFFYSNSWIIADANKAWILESADRNWVALNVRDFRSISNGLSIETEFDLTSDGLIDFAKKQGWHKSGDFNFRKSFADRFFTYFSKGGVRRSCSTKLGSASKGTLDAMTAMKILRDHGSENFDPANGDMGSLCLHATGLLTPSQTTGSLVAEIRKDKPSTYWLTGSAAPCLSVFKPFYSGGKSLLYSQFKQPGATADDSLWWKSETFHRRMLPVYKTYHHEFANARDELETEFAMHQEEFLNGLMPARDDFSNDCLKKADDLIARWSHQIGSAGRKKFAPIYNMNWNKWNKAAGIA